MREIDLKKLVKDFGLSSLLEKLRALVRKRDELNAKLESIEPTLKFCKECGAPAIKVFNERFYRRYYVCSRYHNALVALWSMDINDPRRDQYLGILDQHQYEYAGMLLEERPNPEYEKLKKERDAIAEKIREVREEYLSKLESLPLSKDEKDCLYGIMEAIIAAPYGLPLSVGVWCHED
jgi:ssDNA-binding Zn-finger/Zn-ribbon topoisomerase 1